MKLYHILEAREASRHKAPTELVVKPRLQREGDFVWHLYKFFDPDETDTVSKKNPEHKKELAKVLASVITDFKKKFPKNVELQNMPTGPTASKMATASWLSNDEDFEPWPYDPDEGYDDEDEWRREMDEERRWHEENRGWNVNAYRAMEDKFTRHKGHGGHKPNNEKLMNAIAKEGKRRLGAINDRLPTSTLPTASMVYYKPKKGLRAFANGDHIENVKVRINAKGQVTSASFLVSTGGGRSKQQVIKDLTKKTPAELRELLKYYKEHTDW